MARKPTQLVAEAAKLKPQGRQGVWTAMRARRHRPFTLVEIRDATDIPSGTVLNYARALALAGFLELQSADPAHPFSSAIYLLANDCGAEAPRLDKTGKPVTQGLGREQMWRAMKMLSGAGDFDYRDLAITARTDVVPVAEETAEDYVKYLAKAGYLALTHAASNAGRLARYRLVRNTGARPPVVTRLRTVFDPNLGKLAWHEEVRDG
jgi:hypothetical protein